MDEIDEPIYDVAVECERLFETQIARFNQASDGNGAALIAELSHQFYTWANSLKVFDDGNLNLDHKLQGHAEIQDQVLRGLDLILANLSFVHMRDTPSDGEEAGGLVLDQSPQLSIDNVEAVSEALKRLQQIETVIRYSSATSHARQAREHTEGLDLSSFTQVASLSLKSLFRAASPELLQQLTVSMTDTYRVCLYRREKEESQEKRRYPRAFRLSTIPEGPSDEEMQEEKMPGSGPRQDIASNTSRTFQAPHHRPVAPQSRPTTIDTREAASRLGKLQRPPAQRSAASILVSHVDYPKPADGGNTCDWCFKSLPKDTFQGDKWQEHVNEDHRPFVCISEKCMQSPSLLRFPTWRKWFKHMVDAHGPEWHRQVHAPSQWRCPLCDDNTIKFSSPEDLMEHFEGKHNDMALAGTQKGSIVRQSRASYPRPRDECPLCCLPIKDEEIYLHYRKKDNDNKRNASNRAPRPESEKKRLKTETGQQASTLPIGGSGPKPSSPPETMLAPEVVARHVAGHLRTVMLLTLRIISIDGPVEVSSDKESVSGKTDDQLSRVASSHDDLGERSDISAASSHPGDLAEGYQLQDLEDTIPEQEEIIAWPDILGEENSLVDNFLQQAVKQRAFQSHSGEDKNRTTENSWTSNKVERNSHEQSDTEEAFGIAWRAYERRLSEREQRLALRAFQWVLCSYDPPNTQKLSMIMLIDPESDEVDELNGEAEKLLRRGGIGDLCGSLLSFDADHDVWDFKNPSAADYFGKNHCEGSRAFAFAGMTCLKFLITDPCAANRTNCGCEGKADTIMDPCSVFRAEVMYHLQPTESAPTCHDKRLAELEKRFFGSPQSSSIAYRTWAQTWGGSGEVKDRLKPASSPLFAMAAFGLFRLLEDWWLDPQIDLGILNDQGYSLLALANGSDRDKLLRLVESRTPTMPPTEPGYSDIPTHHDSGTSGIDSRSTPANDGPELLSPKHHPSHTSGESRQTLDNFSFLFILNKLIIGEPERDEYYHLIPPRQPDMYLGEVRSKVMRYSNGEVSEALGYHWIRGMSGVKGHLLRHDSSGNYTSDPSTGDYHMAQKYKTFAVFACNPLLPLMVTDTDPQADATSAWDLLRIFHPRNHSGLSQVVTLKSDMEDGGAPVRYAAGKSPSWMPALIPTTYENPHPHGRPSGGLGGELGIILGLMALTADRSPRENEAVNKAFLEKRQWHRNEWRGPKSPKGYPETAQDDPQGFLSVVFLDPENPNSTVEALSWFEWQTPIVRES